MIKWEHQSKYIKFHAVGASLADANHEENFNKIAMEYGNEGWELISVLPAMMGVTAYFKRRAIKSDEVVTARLP